MKKFISTLLIISLCISLNSSVFAYSNDNEILVSLDETGHYYVDSTSTSENDVIAMQTEDEGIYSLEDGTLISETGVGSYQIVDRLEVSLADEGEIAQLLSNDRLSSNIKDSLEARSEFAILNGNTEAQAIIFVPKQQLLRAGNTRYYVYNGYNMMEELVYYKNLNTNWEVIASGSNTNTIAKSVYSIIADLAGYATTAISLFNSAANAYNAYIQATGQTPINGNYEDSIEMKIYYDIYTKYTYANIDGLGYDLGSVTQSVKFLKNETDHNYVNYYGGSVVRTTRTSNQTVYTEHYLNPAPTAVANVYSPYVEEITAKVYNHPINL